MMRSTLALLVLANLFQSAAHADGAPAGCPNIRLDQGDGPVAPIPIHAQPDELGICYAIVASEMADAYRFSSPDADRKQITSYLVTAASFSAMYRDKMNKLGVESRNGIDGGSVADALQALKLKGGCDQNRLFKSPSKINVEQDLSDLKALLKTYQKSAKNSSDTAASNVCGELAQTSFSDGLVYFQKDFGRIFTHPQFYDYLDDFFTETCSSITIPMSDLPRPRQVVLMKKTDDEKRQLLSDTLKAAFGQAHPQPVAIDYCDEALTTEDQPFGRQTLSCTQHGSLIVGVRANPSGNCGEVLLRYTEGPICDLAVKAAQCDKDVPGEYWVSVDKLSKKTLDLLYLQHD